MGGMELAESFIIKLFGIPNSINNSSIELLAQQMKSTDGIVDSEWDACRELFYNLSTNTSSSYLMECIIQLVNVELLYHVVYHVLIVQGNVLDYALDGSGNFVIQAIISRLTRECKQLIHSNEAMKEQQRVSNLILRYLLFTILSTIYATTSNESDKVIFIDRCRYDIITNNGGIVLHSLDALKYHDMLNELPANALSTQISTVVLQCWIIHSLMPSVYKEQEVNSPIKLNEDPKTGTLIPNITQASVNQMVQARLMPILDDKNRTVEETVPGNSRVTTQILFAKQLESLMLLTAPEIVYNKPKQLVCKVSKYIVTSISTLPAATIVYLAKQGQLSKPCLDRFVDIVCKNTNDSIPSGASTKKVVNAVYSEDLRRFVNTLMVNLM